MRSIEAKARWAGQLMTPSKRAVLGGLGLAIALVACGDSAEDSGSGTHDTEAGEPTTSSADLQGSGGETSSADTPRDPTSEETAESEEPEPIPASSEGPAENWPEPEVPDALYEPTEEGAEALIQYWFEARHYARITGDVEPWQYASHNDCDICTSMIQNTTAFHNNGWHVGESDQVLDLRVKVDDAHHASGILMLDQAPFDSYWEGELRSETAGDPESTFGFAGVFTEERWQARELNYLGSGEGERSYGGDNDGH